MDPVIEGGGPCQDVHMRGKSHRIMGKSPLKKRTLRSQRVDTGSLKMFGAVATEPVRPDCVYGYQKDIYIFLCSFWTERQSRRRNCSQQDEKKGSYHSFLFLKVAMESRHSDS